MSSAVSSELRLVLVLPMSRLARAISNVELRYICHELSSVVEGRCGHLVLSADYDSSIHDGSC